MRPPRTKAVAQFMVGFIVAFVGASDASAHQRTDEMNKGTDRVPQAATPRVQIRVGDDIRDAPDGDQRVAASYAGSPDKGPIFKGRRLTILTATNRILVHQSLRVLHVAEAMDATTVLYPAGPKAIHGEQVDGTPEVSLSDPAGDPLYPQGVYDGPVVHGPSVDFGYEVTTHRFDSPGIHRIVWRLGEQVSNELVIEVHGSKQ